MLTNTWEIVLTSTWKMVLTNTWEMGLTNKSKMVLTNTWEMVFTNTWKMVLTNTCEWSGLKNEIGSFSTHLSFTKVDERKILKDISFSFSVYNLYILRLIVLVSNASTINDGIFENMSSSNSLTFD